MGEAPVKDRLLTSTDDLAQAEATSGSLSQLARAEIDVQVATAKAHPRSIKAFMDEATQLATLDEEVAKSCIYVLPRGGKNIEGPSARFAEIIAYSFRNLRYGARPIMEQDKHLTSQGVCYDLERNNGTSIEVRRRITKSNGSRFDDDMIGVTSNAANSIALRNAVLKIVPKALWNPIYQRARRVVLGDFETFGNRLAKAVDEFQRYGVTRDMLLAKLDRRGMQDVKMEDLVVLSGILTAIKEGDTTVEETFADVTTNLKQPQAKAEGPKVEQPKTKEPAPQAESGNGSPAAQAESVATDKPAGQPIAPVNGDLLGEVQTPPPTPVRPLTKGMVKQIDLRIEQYGCDRDAFLKHFGVNAVEEIALARTSEVMTWIDQHAASR